MNKKELIGFIMYLLDELQHEIDKDDVDTIKDVYIEDQTYIPWQEKWEEMSDSGFFRR